MGGNPLSLVDFEATKRAQEEEKAIQKKELEEGREIEQQRFDKPGRWDSRLPLASTCLRKKAFMPTMECG